MPTMDVFNSDAFSLRSLTAAIEKAPHRPGRIGELGLFVDRPVSTTIVQVEEKDGQLTLIPTSPRGGVPDSIGADARRMRAFKVPHLARESQILADEIQGVRAFGTESELETVQSVVNDRLATLRAMHEVTREHLRMGALKGLILDADGLTTIYDLFSEFGVEQHVVDFDFADPTLEVRSKCKDVLRAIEDELGAATYTRAHAFCSASWFDALIDHPIVKETFKYREGEVLRQDIRRGFEFGGITFEEYRGKVGAVDFIADGEAYCFPLGAMVASGPLFQTFNAPADFEETVNTPGQPIYAKLARDLELNRWVKLHTQSNPLPLCLRPAAVIKLTMVGST